MKVLSVCGITQSGKTTTVEAIIKELKKRRYSVGSIKDIHFEKFAIDTEGTNTYRHRQAGAELVSAWGLKETDVLFPIRLSFEELLKFYSQDFVIVEGFAGGAIPKIVTAHNENELRERVDGLTIAISGRVADTLNEYKGIPAFSVLDNPSALVDLIEEKVFPKLPGFPPECCEACGASCTELAVRILEGEARWQDCMVLNSHNNIELSVDGHRIPMVPFVQDILFNAIKGVVRELDGYKKGAPVDIQIRKL